jgi:mono/diheme cytochrome c family protein
MKTIVAGLVIGFSAILFGLAIPLGIFALMGEFDREPSAPVHVAERVPERTTTPTTPTTPTARRPVANAPAFSSVSRVTEEPSNHAANPSKGEEQFNIHCAACHQVGGEGKIGLAPSLRNRDFLALASDDFIRQTIRKGRMGTSMIPRADLSDNTVSDLIAYLRAVPVEVSLDVTVDPTLKIEGDVVRGEHSFGLYCSSCHGPKGEGYSAGVPGPGIGLPGFLSVASDDYIYKTLEHGRIGTAMRPFLGSRGLANLDPQEARDVVAYVRSLEGVTPVVAAAPQISVADAGLGDSAAGATHFVSNCSPCHQPGGEGKIGLAPSIRNRDFLTLASDDFIRTTINKGRPGTAMVGRPDLGPKKINDIIAFLRDVDFAIPLEIEVDPSREISGDPALGHHKFALFCASCHGPGGEGYSAGGSGPGIGLAGFLDTASDDYIFQTVKYGRLGTAMKGFIGAEGLANLSEEDVGDIIAHLRHAN